MVYILGAFLNNFVKNFTTDLKIFVFGAIVSIFFAVEIVIEAGQASISMLQRRMRVGYARAGRLIDEMAQRGIVSEAGGGFQSTVVNQGSCSDLGDELLFAVILCAEESRAVQSV